MLTPSHASRRLRHRDLPLTLMQRALSRPRRNSSQKAAAETGTPGDHAHGWPIGLCLLVPPLSAPTMNILQVLGQPTVIVSPFVLDPSPSSSGSAPGMRSRRALPPQGRRRSRICQRRR